MGRKKGFTLIEIMIVLSIIGILSMVLIPKVGGIKLNSKNNSITTNVLLVRTYLENRAGKDGIAFKIATQGTPAQTSEAALKSIQANVGSDMKNNFFGSNELTNPFNNSSSINYTQGNVTGNSPDSSSVVLGYNSLSELPSDTSVVQNNLPKGQVFVGNVVVVIYSTGYVLYGVNNNGEMTDIYMIKFPPTPPLVQSGVYPGNGGGGGNPDISEEDFNLAVNSNYEKVRDYIVELANEKELLDMHLSISSNFVNEKNLINPSDLDWKTIALNGSSNENNSVVVISQHNDKVDPKNYKGCVIVKAHDGSDNGKSYYIYDVGFDGTILKEGILRFQQGEYQYNGD